MEIIQQRRTLFVLLCAAAILSSPAIARAQGDASAKATEPAPVEQSSDLPKYEVATIKPTSASDGRRMFFFTPDGITLTGVPVEMLLTEAFHLEDDHIIGAPGWVKANRYDVQAKVSPEDAPRLDKLKPEERRAMLVPLLLERFNLKYHQEKREMASYTLVVAKGGPKLKVSEVQPPAPDAKPADGGTTPKAGDAGEQRPQQRRMLRYMGRGHLEAEGSSTEMLARVLSQQLGRTVIDKTGLTGSYDYTLQWTPDDAPPPMPGGAGGAQPHNDSGTDAVGPSLLTALQEQLGLKLESTKGMADVIVIDHIDLPSEN